MECDLYFRPGSSRRSDSGAKKKKKRGDRFPGVQLNSLPTYSPLMTHMGRFCLKRISRLEVYERVRVSLIILKYTIRHGDQSLWSVKGPNRANRYTKKEKL